MIRNQDATPYFPDSISANALYCHCELQGTFCYSNFNPSMDK